MAEASYGRTAGGQQVLILKEGTSQSRGKQRRAQNNNITAAKLVAEVVRSCLGPKGMDKMLVDGMGDVTITNDGATILKEIDVQHPAAKMMVEISKTIDNEVGDGTTSAVVLTGALLGSAEDLISKGVHPVVIVEGYRKASVQALKILDRISIKIEPTDIASLIRVARTSMASKLVSNESVALAGLLVDALLQVAEQIEEGNYKVDIDNIKVEKRTGGSLKDTVLVSGVILDKEIAHPSMPRRVNNARIALVSSPLEIEKTQFDAKINISKPEQIKMFLDEETKMLREMVETISNSGANVLVCQKGIDDVAQHYLAKASILAVRRVKESDMIKLAKATGARVVTGLDDLSTADLGVADVVEERKVEEDKWVFVEGCENPKAVTVLIRGGSQKVIDEAERSMHDAIMVIKDVLEKPAVVGGGGAVEEELFHQLMEWSSTLSGREQLAARGYAEALESIPLALAENAGFDTLDIQTELREKHDSGKVWYGVDVLGNGVQDIYNKGVIEPASVKEQIIKSATECSCMILRIDDVIASSKMKAPPGGLGGMGGGMGGME
ncbi:MAG: TCP-1/cpn60 chaperonin family protein [Thaumarchaeota archaeon]|nr:TCP-1/cpn60 chaperonin family protein [Nitrososphaerota archaeon]MCL5317221.1 TCP-1/cpn60 chaperonin family protein [Nitrososphaerota archaeon]